MIGSRTGRLAIVALSAIAALTAGACAPGSSASGPAAKTGPVSKDVAAAGKVTLTVWDQNTDGGISKAQEQLNQAFEKRYPNVTINRVSRSFNDLKTTLKLALSSNNPPDVVQANQGYPDMGTFVKAGLLRPADDYAKLYGWDSYYPKQLLDLNKFTPDGKKWQSGNLYGVSQTGEMIGIYYNKQVLSRLGLKPPATIGEFDAMLPKIAAAGVQPIAYGDVEKSPGIQLYGMVQAALAGKGAVDNLVTGKSGAWTDPASEQAAQMVKNWADAGYLTRGGNGISRTAALSAFERGESAFNINGTWRLEEVSKAMGDNAGFVTLAPNGSTDPVTTGGEGLAWSITSGSKHPDVSAAYIDFITNAEAGKTLIDSGNLPAVPPASWNPAPGSTAADIADRWRQINQTNGMVPYLDYTTPTFYDTLSAEVQQLTSGQRGPADFGKDLQSDYAAFLKSGN